MTQTNLSPAPAGRQRSPWVNVGVGCAIVAVCALCAGAAVADYFYTRRPTPVASRPAVEYILDASPRMAQPSDGENGTRMAVAEGVLAEIVRPSDPSLTAGLRVFGTGAAAAGCNDTDLLVPLAPANQGQISTHVLQLTTGANPAAAMGQAIITAIRDLSATKGEHALVVVTGGPDACNPQAGQLIAAEAQKAGIQFQLFVVGYQVSTDDGNAIKGLVDSAGGNYVNAKSKSELTTVLGSIQQYVNNSSVNSLASVLATTAAVDGAGAAGVVTSDDGLAQLTIPAGALPPGTRVSDVHIVKMAPNSQAASPGADLPFADYRLEPDGLTNRLPLTFSLNVAGQAHSLPLLWSISKDKAEILPQVHVSVDMTANKQVVSAPVSHFSTIAAAYGFFDVTVSDPGSVAVRSTFGVSVTVSRSAQSGHVMTALDDKGNLNIPTISVVTNGKAGPPLATYIRITSEAFAVAQGFFLATKPIVSPEQILHAPDRQASAAGNVTISDQFQCVQAGAASITHDAYIEFQQEIDTFVLPAGAGSNYQPPASALTTVPEKTETTKLFYRIVTSVNCSPAAPTPIPTGTSTTSGLPKVSTFVAKFDAIKKSTFYTVTASDPTGGQLSYAWSNSNKCGQFIAGNAPTAEWHHSDLPGGCPVERVHPGTITVIVGNSFGDVTCVYPDGSADGDVAQCVNSR